MYYNAKCTGYIEVSEFLLHKIISIYQSYYILIKIYLKLWYSIRKVNYNSIKRVTNLFDHIKDVILLQWENGKIVRQIYMQKDCLKKLFSMNF